MTSDRRPWLVVGLAVTLTGVVLLLRPDGSLMDYFRHALLATAWVSFAFFLAAYSARPLQQMTGRARWLVLNRRYLGLGAAFAHTVHFGYIIVWVMATDGDGLNLVVLLFGGSAFVLLWLMTLTSNDWSVRRLGERWKLLHRVGLHYLWFIYVYTFVGGALVDPSHGVFAAAGFAAAGLRFAAWRAQRVSRTG